MADTVTTAIMSDTTRQIVIHRTCSSDASNEADAVVIDKSVNGLISGVEASKLAIREITWSAQGYTRALIEFDRTSDVSALFLPGSGFYFQDFTMRDSPLLDLVSLAGVEDSGSGGTGDVLITTTGGVSGASYILTLICAKIP